MRVSALYVDVERGPYRELGLDCWGLERDATKYDGPGPIVAHPPCGPWGRMKGLCSKQDPSLALRAVEQVRRWGGVLEHPEGSTLWSLLGLPSPIDPAQRLLPGIGAGPFTLAVEQVHWGHPCRKRTWLYLVGIDRDKVPPMPAPVGVATHVITTTGTYPAGRLPSLSKNRRHVTPTSFGAWLVECASHARPA